MSEPAKRSLNSKAMDIMPQLRAVTEEVIALNNDQRAAGHMPDPDSGNAEFLLRRAITHLAKTGRL